MAKRKFAKLKKMINLKEKKIKEDVKNKEDEELVNEDPQFSEFFKINHNLVPPYNVIIDTNFINQSIQKKLDLETELIRCLYSSVVICVTDCVIAELEKLGRVFRVALAIVKNNKFKRLTCDHKGTYVDDCIVNRVTAHRCYVVATCDTELKQRVRKVPGVPILYIKGKKYEVEKLPNAPIKK